MKRFRLGALWLGLLAARAVASAAPAEDGSGYSFTQPVPAAQLRELNTDRPDATEGPYTVDAGHVQLEMDGVTMTRHRLDGERTRDWSVAPFNLRFGIRQNFELGFFAEPYLRITREPPGGGRTTLSGLGDVTLRSKFNFRGNDGQGLATGGILDVKIPTARAGLGNGAIEGAAILPVAGELAGGWEFGAMTGVAFRHRDEGGVAGVWINTATIGHDLAKGLGGYLEVTSEAGEGPHVATFNLGFTRRLDANTQVDAGVNLGLSRQADDAQVFTGISRRF